MAINASQQDAWARLIKQHKLRDRRWDEQTLEEHKQHALLDLRFQKRVLDQAIQVRDYSRIQQTVEQLFALRAKQTVFALQELEQTMGELDRETVTAYGRQYVRDCLNMAKAVDSLLSHNT
jgi:hypothetical protein